MTVYIKKTDTMEDIKRKMARVMRARGKKRKGFPAHKFLGVMKGVYGDPLEYQKKMRDEWER